MSEPFLSEIRIMGFNYAPVGWARCDGQFMPINQNQALFALLGTTFGGNGQTTFALPDLRARVPMHVGSGHTLGEKGGEPAHTTSIAELPTHTHVVNAIGGDANAADATGAFFSIPAAAVRSIYATTAGSLTAMIPSAVANTGGSQPHENRQPFLALLFCIALQGVFPSPT